MGRERRCAACLHAKAHLRALRPIGGWASSAARRSPPATCATFATIVCLPGMTLRGAASASVGGSRPSIVTTTAVASGAPVCFRVMNGDPRLDLICQRHRVASCLLRVRRLVRVRRHRRGFERSDRRSRSPSSDRVRFSTSSRHYRENVGPRARESVEVEPRQQRRLAERSRSALALGRGAP